METSTEIKLVTKPKIVHKLQEFGASVTKRLEDLNINNLVATEDSMKSLKELRAELNKELANFEDQRKFIKNEIMNPFNEFEGVYKTEIADKYKSAIDMLKDKIALVETKIKDEKKAKVKTYYDELCLAEKINFIPFEKVGLDINLSTSEKAFKEKCSEFINRVIDDLNLIKTTDFQAEILTEYKVSLNASLAITTVKTRKENEKIETARLLQVLINNRMAKVKSLGMIYDDFTKTFVYNDEVFITYSFIHDSSNDEFTKKFIECEEKIKETERAKNSISDQGQIHFATSGTSSPISTPIVKETSKEELVTASFEVTGTMAQLKVLGQYMKDNQINYKNI